MTSKTSAKTGKKRKSSHGDVSDDVTNVRNGTHGDMTDEENHIHGDVNQDGDGRDIAQNDKPGSLDDAILYFESCELSGAFKVSSNNQTHITNAFKICYAS